MFTYVYCPFHLWVNYIRNRLLLYLRGKGIYLPVAEKDIIFDIYLIFKFFENDYEENTDCYLCNHRLIFCFETHMLILTFTTKAVGIL